MERSIVALEDHDHGSSSTALSKSVESLVKIDSISIDLGISMEKNEAGKCHHFSIRGYVADMRRKDTHVCLPFTSGGQTSNLEEQLPPLHVAKFRWWRCQNCLEEIGAPTAHMPHHCDKAVVLFSDMQQEAAELPSSEANEAEENIIPAGKNNLSLSNDKKEKNTGVGQTSVNGHGNVEEGNVDENVLASTLCENENHFTPCNDKKDQNTSTEHTTVIGHKNGSQDGSIQEGANTDCDQARYNSSLNQTRCTYDRDNTKVSCFQTVSVALKNSSLVDMCLPTHGSHGAADTFPATKYPVCRGNSSAEENFASIDEEQRNVLEACEEPKEAGLIDEPINSVKDQLVEHPSLEMESRDNPSSERGEILAADLHQDQQNVDDSIGFPRRKTRKVRLLTDLLCGRQITESNHRKKEGSPFNSVTNESSALASVSASPSKVSLRENVSTVSRVPQMKRKMPHNQEKKLVDMDCPSNGVKKAKFFKGDADASIMGTKNSGSGSEETSTAAGLLNSDKHKWTNYETQRNSSLGKNKKKMTPVGDNFFPMVPWPQIMAKMNNVNIGDSDKQAASAGTTSKSNHDLFTGKGIDPYFRSCAPSQQTERKSSLSKKKTNKPQLEDGQALVRPQINQMFGEGSPKRQDVDNMSGSGLGNLQSETELGLSLSLTSNAQRNEKDNSSLREDQNGPLLPLTKSIPSRDIRRKDNIFVGQQSIPREATPYPASTEGSFYDLNQRINRRAAILHEQLNFSPELSNGSLALNQKLDFSDPLRNKGNGVVPGSSEAVRVHNHQRPEKVVVNGTSEDIPMDIVLLMAKNQYERGLCEAGTSYSQPGTSNKRNPELIGFPKVNGNEMILFEKEYPTMRKPPLCNATNGMIPTAENMAPIRSSASFFHHNRNLFNMGQQVECPPFAMLDSFSQNQQKLSSGVHFSDSGTLRNQNPQNSEWNPGNKMAHRSPPTNMQVIEAFNTYHSDFRHNEAAGNVLSHNHMPIGHKSPQKSTAQSSNIEMCDIDLNLGLPNDASLEEQNKILDLEPLNRVSGEYPRFTKAMTMEHNPKQRSSLDSSYSNDSIPAMQLLSLMDAGMISSTPFGLDGKKFLEKPFSPCNNHPSLGTDGNPDSMEKPHFPYSGLRPGIHKPIESSRHLSSERSPAIPVANGFSLFRNDGNVKGSTSYRGQAFARAQHQEKTRGSYSPSQSRGRRTEESAYPIVGSSNTSKDKQKGILFSGGNSVGCHLPWHSISDSSKCVGVGAQFMQVTASPTSCQSGTDVCTINRNPADFSLPESGNVYMISSEDLKFGKKISFRGKSALENLDGRKRQRIIKSIQKERAHHHAS